jgi:polyhydroxyalkanoate synthesis repressor PhaR
MLRQFMDPLEVISLFARPRSKFMRVIKRYPNRKLYDTEAKQYISLDQIAEFIREGEDVYVVDNATGEDLTTVTLTQIIFEQEKKGSGFLPQSVLTGLIQAGGSTLSALRRTLASSVDLLHQVDDEIERRIQVLANRGELAEDEAARLRDKLMGRRHSANHSGQVVDQEVERVLAKQGVPTRADLQHLAQRLEEVAAKLDSLSDASSPAAGEPPSGAAPPGAARHGAAPSSPPDSPPST